MNGASDPPAFQARMASQLLRLAEVVEGLTWRMMELEERLELHGRRRRTDRLDRGEDVSPSGILVRALGPRS